MGIQLGRRFRPIRARRAGRRREACVRISRSDLRYVLGETVRGAGPDGADRAGCATGAPVARCEGIVDAADCGIVHGPRRNVARDAGERTGRVRRMDVGAGAAGGRVRVRDRVWMAAHHATHKQIEALDNRVQEQNAQIVSEQSTIEVLAAKDTVVVSLAEQKQQPQGTARVLYNARRGMIVYNGTLPEAPPDKSYELWRCRRAAPRST